MASVDLVVKNGKVVLPSGVIEGGVAIDGEKIVAVGQGNGLPEGRKIIDAKGMYILPGVIDPHAHPGGKYDLGDDWKTESPGAAAGGVTTVGAIVRVPRMGQKPFKELPGPEDVISWLDAFDLGKKVSEENSLVDFFFTPTLNSMQHAEEIPQYYDKLGITSYKYHGNLKVHADNPVSPKWSARIGIPLPFDDTLAYLMFEESGKLGPMTHVAVHNENVEIAKIFTERLQAAGRTDSGAWADRIPEWLEAEHISRYSYFAKVTGSTHYVLHLSTSAGLEECIRQKEDGVSILVETCPQYLLVSAYAEFPGLLTKVNPPLRDPEVHERLWEGLADGDIEIMGTDHVVTSLHEKLVKGDTSDHDGDPAKDIWETGSGMVGWDFLLPLMLSEGVNKGRISIGRLVEVCCENPARACAIYPRKGVIAPGSDGDLVVVDMDVTRSIKADMLRSKADFSIYEGMEVTGWPVTTILRGEVIYDDGQVTDRKGGGKYLRRPC